MEIFYSTDIAGGSVRLNAEESAHCVRVLRHREGDPICVVDGEGTMYRCTISDISGSSHVSAGKHAPAVVARIDSSEPGWHGHPYRLTMAVCPTKNIDRYEWMTEKLTEIGVDRIVPVIGDRSERRIIKTDRLRRLIVSAGKQSLKSAFPVLDEPVSVREFVASLPTPSSPAATGRLRFIAYCSDEVQPRAGLMEALSQNSNQDIEILIGPEGDFSPEEVRAAMDAGFIPVHLGESRLRTETAAVVAATAVYLRGTQITE